MFLLGCDRFAHWRIEADCEASACSTALAGLAELAKEGQWRCEKKPGVNDHNQRILLACRAQPRMLDVEVVRTERGLQLDLDSVDGDIFQRPPAELSASDLADRLKLWVGAGNVRVTSPPS